ncbi:hypothetical protein NQ317_015253 [Molorchus minor]|uniref:Uncharacterized protein n=1 Tax=Molorchus minor TaxID=1323400 RepID=A0ABQ9IWX0_9CUCU|nr:hypothetical protein NQ317_015253 [Molorchus minor]
MQFLRYMWIGTSMKELPNHKKPPVNQILQLLPMVCPLLYKENSSYPVPVLALWIQAINAKFHFLKNNTNQANSQ